MPSALPAKAPDWFAPPAASRRTLAVARAAVLLACAALAWWKLEIVNDDAYITFVHARNLASGNGLVYRAGEHVLGTTSPLWAMLLAFFHLVTGRGIPVLAKLLDIACLTLAAYGLEWLLDRRRTTWLALAVAPPLFFGASIHWGTGNETALLFLVVTATLVAWRMQRRTLAFGLAALAFLVRGEGVLLVPLLLAHALLVERRLPRVRELLPAALLLGAWLAFCQAFFGSILPNTFGAKAGEWTGPTFAERLPAAVRAIVAFEEQGVLLLAVAALGLVLVAAREPLLLGWAALHVGGYSLLGAASHEWYYHSLGLLWAVGTACAVERIAARLWPPAPAGWRGLATFVLGVCLVVAAPGLRYRHADDLARYVVYQEVADYLAVADRAHEPLIAQEIGILAWRLQTPPHDADFLVEKRTPGLSHRERVERLLRQRMPVYYVSANRAADGRPLSELHFGPDSGPQRISYVVERDFASRVGDGQTYAAAVYRRVGAPPTPPISPPQGFLEVAGCRIVQGWAAGAGHPLQRIGLELRVDGRRVQTLVADQPRADLAAAGFGDAAFALPWPAELSDGREHEIAVMGVGSGVHLTGSPARVTCAPGEVADRRVTPVAAPGSSG